MYEYKVVEVKNSKKAEEIMNAYAKEGWRVISNVYWTKWQTILVITFEREIK